MAPTGGKSKGKGRDVRSRNTTPISSASTEQSQAGTSVVSPTMSYDQVFERYCRGTSPPASATLKKIAENLRGFTIVAKTRSDNCDRGMREFSKRRKDLLESIRDQELAERAAEEERQERIRKSTIKKERDENRPLAVGAHSLARQDGVETKDQALGAISPIAPTQPDAAEATLPPTVPLTPSSSESAPVELHPLTAIPDYQTFGPDPSTFDDPTIYHLGKVDPDMTEEEKKRVLGVVYYPQDDLHDLTPGTPPDRDFSNAKPANQVTANQFATYLEPYVRPLTEDDLAFLKERGDRVTPFIMPRRGLRSYKEIWAEEDGTFFNEPESSNQQTSTNQASGSMDQMNDEVAETSDVSLGPMMARLLATMRPERRAPLIDGSSTAVMNEESSVNPQAEGDDVAQPGTDEQHSRPHPPATFMQESTQPGWKNSGPKVDSADMNERLKQELRYMGFLPEDAEPDYDGHYDDPVAAQLRALQEQLHKTCIKTGAMKARVAEVAGEEMAKQEYATIADDLDNQLNQSFSKRHRNFGKSKKNSKRAGGGAASGSGGVSAAAGAAGMSKPGVGEPIRALMERRSDWKSLIGPVVDNGNMTTRKQSIFDKETMARLEAKEEENWNEAQEQS